MFPIKCFNYFYFFRLPSAFEFGANFSMRTPPNVAAAPGSFFSFFHNYFSNSLASRIVSRSIVDLP